jgi:DNA-binding SARP family transcriptional activator
LISDGEALAVRRDAQRLVAFLALNSEPQAREQAAGTLWPESTQDRANGNLRTAIWRAKSAVPGLITVPEAHHLSIATEATVDVRSMESYARSLISDVASTPVGELNATWLAADLLPGWYDEWVVAEREHLRQLRLRALETLSQELLLKDHPADALEAAMAAIALDPFRETAHRCVMRIHLAEGNATEAIFHFERYERLLHQELGISPSRELAALLPRRLPVGSSTRGIR